MKNVYRFRAVASSCSFLNCFAISFCADVVFRDLLSLVDMLSEWRGMVRSMLACMRGCGDVREMTIKKLLCGTQVHLGCWV